MDRNRIGRSSVSLAYSSKCRPIALGSHFAYFAARLDSQRLRIHGWIGCGKSDQSVGFCGMWKFRFRQVYNFIVSVIVCGVFVCVCVCQQTPRSLHFFYIHIYGYAPVACVCVCCGQKTRFAYTRCCCCCGRSSQCYTRRTDTLSAHLILIDLGNHIVRHKSTSSTYFTPIKSILILITKDLFFWCVFCWCSVGKVQYSKSFSSPNNRTE